MLERSERESSLLVLLDAGRGDRSPLDVDGRRESVFCADFLLQGEIERRIQDGDNRSLEVGVSVDMTSSDIEIDWALMEVSALSIV